VPYAGFRIRSKALIPRRLSPWRRCLREPLLHFLLVGAAVAGLTRLWSAHADAPPALARVELTAEEYRQMQASLTGQPNSPPAAEELRRLIDQRIREEILCREALAMGLDQGDAVIRQRLAQKMEIFTDHAAGEVRPPRPDELRAWFSTHVERFRIPGQVTFRQLCFSFDHRGPDAPADAALALVQLAGGGANCPAAAADSGTLDSCYRNCSLEQVSELFGAKFARRLFSLKGGLWQGPVESSLGWHLVFVESITPGRAPPFEEVEMEVRESWLAEQRAAAKARMFEAMKTRYVIVLPTPAADKPDLPVLSDARHP
jgi:hypothetical protein